MVAPRTVQLAAHRFEARLPRRTVRLRLTLIYGSLFIACGAALLTITYVLVAHTRTTSRDRTPAYRPARQAPARISSAMPGERWRWCAPASTSLISTRW